MQLQLAKEACEAAAIIATEEVQTPRFKNALAAYHTIIPGPALLAMENDPTLAKVAWKFVDEVDDRMGTVKSGRLDE